MPANGTTRTTIQMLVTIDAALARPSGATVGELCERLDCHQKTVQRQLAWLQKTFGVMVVTWNGTGLGRRIGYPHGATAVFSAWVRETLA